MCIQYPVHFLTSQRWMNRLTCMTALQRSFAWKRDPSWQRSRSMPSLWLEICSASCKTLTSKLHLTVPLSLVRACPVIFRKTLKMWVGLKDLADLQASAACSPVWGKEISSYHCELSLSMPSVGRVSVLGGVETSWSSLQIAWIFGYRSLSTNSAETQISSCTLAKKAPAKLLWTFRGFRTRAMWSNQDSWSAELGLQSLQMAWHKCLHREGLFTY